jgi:predicted RNase H-like nuclease
VRFIGVDLGWTARGGTGLCDVEGGSAVESTRLSTDGEIVDWLSARTHRDALVAIDAPLIVRNARPSRVGLSRREVLR